MDLTAWSKQAELLKPILECLAIVLGGAALLKWMQERDDRASDVLLKLEEEFETKCKNGRPLLEDEDKYGTVQQALQNAVAESKDGARAISRQTDIDNLLRFYVVLFAVRQQRQVGDASMSTCYRYWLAHYYWNDRLEFRRYVNAFFPTLRKWLRADTSWWRRLYRRPLSRWWQPFFRPEDFWEKSEIEKDPKRLSA